MAYTQVSLANILSQLSTLLDDPLERYWSAEEKTYAVWEALRVWGAYTNYWRDRGSFNTRTSTGTSSPFYDLSVELPTLRPRVWTLDQITKDIQYACLEAPSGVIGSGMSQQISVQSITQAVKRARNQFVIDALFPVSVLSMPSPAPPDGVISFDQSAVMVHRVTWKDSFTGLWTNLWRDDDYAFDRSNPEWTLESGQPAKFSESELAPLRIQLEPNPANGGTLEALAVLSLDLDITDDGASLAIPDEWVHAVKWGALADIFGSESQNADPLRNAYAEQRYSQAVDLARMARSVMRVLASEKPLPLDSLAAIDSSIPYWRSQFEVPYLSGALYDLVAVAPMPPGTVGLAVDVVRAAPLPSQATDKLQIGLEDIDNVTNYASHILTFKCGGSEFQSTYRQYDDFMKACQLRGNINKAKIRYMQGLLGVNQKEQSDRPDKVEVNA